MLGKSMWKKRYLTYLVWTRWLLLTVSTLGTTVSTLVTLMAILFETKLSHRLTKHINCNGFIDLSKTNLIWSWRRVDVPVNFVFKLANVNRTLQYIYYSIEQSIIIFENNICWKIKDIKVPLLSNHFCWFSNCNSSETFYLLQQGRI